MPALAIESTQVAGRWRYRRIGISTVSSSVGAVISIRTSWSISICPSARATSLTEWTPGPTEVSTRSITRDSPGRSCPMSNSSSRPALCVTPSGNAPSSTTPVATPVPGFEILIESWISLPISTGLGADASRRMSGFVARDRTDASARNVTLAMLPTSPSATGITSIATRASAPGGMAPMAQMSSPDGVAAESDEPSPFVGAGVAGGDVAISVVPVGTVSRSVTLCAGALPTLRTRIS